MELHQLRYGGHPCILAKRGELDRQLPKKVGDGALVLPVHHAAMIDIVPRKVQARSRVSPSRLMMIATVCCAGSRSTDKMAHIRRA